MLTEKVFRRIQRQYPLVERWRKAVMDKQHLQGNYNEKTISSFDIEMRITLQEHIQ